MQYPQNLAVHLALLVLPLVAFAFTWRRVIGMKRRVTLAAVLAFFGAIGAWWTSGYVAPHPFLTLQGGPMNPDLVFVWTWMGLIGVMALIAFIFGGERKEEMV